MSYQKDVEDFMSAGDQPINKELSLQGDQQKLYMNLITEEYKETLEAFENNDLVEVADGLADMVWVIMGMCSSCGIEFNKVWEEVRSSNMSKFVDGKAFPSTNLLMFEDLTSSQTLLNSMPQLEHMPIITHTISASPSATSTKSLFSNASSVSLYSSVIKFI